MYVKPKSIDEKIKECKENIAFHKKQIKTLQSSIKYYTKAKSKIKKKIKNLKSYKGKLIKFKDLWGLSNWLYWYVKDIQPSQISILEIVVDKETKKAIEISSYYISVEEFLEEVEGPDVAKINPKDLNFDVSKIELSLFI